MALIAEGAGLAAVIAGFMAWKRSKKESKNFGNFCICFTKGEKPPFTYVPWISRKYDTEEDYEFDEGQIVEVAMNADVNEYWRNQGVVGIAIVNLDDGSDQMWIRLYTS